MGSEVHCSLLPVQFEAPFQWKFFPPCGLERPALCAGNYVLVSKNRIFWNRLTVTTRYRSEASSRIVRTMYLTPRLETLRLLLAHCTRRPREQSEW
ncbi:hypothetical protein MHYP_G00221460 [Metynnis hypsauchen]